MIKVSSVHKLLFLLILLYAPWASAIETKFSYSDFYKRLAVVKKEGLTRVTPAFYLLDQNAQQPCQLAKAVLETANRQVAITQTPSGELLVPYDVKLKQEKAELVLVFAHEQTDCAMSLQTKLLVPISGIQDVDGLSKIADELEKLMLGQAGFWGKLFLPDFNGISLTLAGDFATDQQAVFSIANTDFAVEQGHVYLSKQWLAEHQGKAVQLADSVIDIKPWLVQ
ncbi:DUF2987 domain-containing protein [Motilimonas sp. KMU-193]|uniref:DUF2987 domain-containing protein n=1 Tax=Motilimonas sp. KMU-193 TaxID=3388668 RepID=UPI00396B0366